MSCTFSDPSIDSSFQTASLLNIAAELSSLVSGFSDKSASVVTCIILKVISTAICCLLPRREKQLTFDVVA